jgi:RHS repeat-associated protein
MRSFRRSDSARARAARWRRIRLVVEQLEARELLSADADGFLGRVYRDLFQRPLDDTGRAAWGALLDQGASRQAVARDILASAECHQRSVEGWYTALLGRAADPEGLNAFVTALDSGAGPEAIQAAVLASPEYAGRRDALSDAAFVQALYGDVLGRAPDAQGSDAFAAALGEGMPRQDVAMAVLASREAAGARVAADYRRFLGREPEPGGLAAWVGLLQQGAPHDWIVAGILTSPEYGLLDGGSAGGSGGSGGAGGPGKAPPTHGGLESGSSLCKAIQCPPPDFVPAAQCGCLGQDLARSAPGAEEDALGAGQVFSGSGSPVRYEDGAVNLATCDLSSGGFGQDWGLTRSWTNAFMTDSFNGNGTVVAEQPYLTQQDGGKIAVVLNARDTRYFDHNGSGGYTAHHFLLGTLKYDSGSDTYVLTDTRGDQISFYGFGTGWLAAQRGRFQSFTDPHGNVTQVSSLTGDGKPGEVQRSQTVGGVTTTESYVNTYVSSGGNAGLMSSETLRRQVGGGSWVTVRQVSYTYYDGTESYGNLGDLKKAQIKDAAGNVLETKYYRYYVAGETGGYEGGLKYVVEGASYSRLAAAVSNPETATDSQVATYADYAFQYNSDMRVSQVVVQGAGCSSCSSGQGTYTYTYTTSGNTALYNVWAMKTIETLPDGNSNIVYTNAADEVMLAVYHDQASGSEWPTFYQYDSQGRTILKAAPSAVSGYSDAFSDLLHADPRTGNYQYLRDSSGLVTAYTYYTSTTADETTAGGVAGYWQETDLRPGETGTAVPQQAVQYFAHSNGSGVTVDPVATSTVYRNSDGTGAETTSYSYTWFSGTAQAQSVAVSRPVVSSSQNGPGSADVTTTYNDTYGRPIWSQDPDGFLTYTAYDVSGAATKSIADVDTTRTGDFSNLPSGWSTPSGGGLHLIWSTEVDNLGRATKVTDPAGNVTYTVYNDPNHEMRTYPGWNSSTNAPTGPTQVVREDRNYSTGYTETLTMSATPAVSGGRPTGTESVSGVQTLSRTYVGAGAQVFRTDDYFNLSGLTYATTLYLGTANTNYYTTLYGYDDRGWQDRVQLPTGTIQRTVRDGLGRVVSQWVGTNDTPASGEWDPSNNTSPANMVQTASYVYDGGGVGDGDLTQQTQYPGGSAANRVTQFFYDWRDRQVASKQGVQTSEDTTTHRPIFYMELDNLGEATAQEQYDGDGVTVTDANGDGVPDKPSASRLRARSSSRYDDQARVYRSNTYSVDQSSGAISTNSLATNTWYNHRGLVIKVSVPGGPVQKTQYDGAGRPVKTFTTDGGGDSSWSDAGNVTGDAVLTQAQTQYDADGNPILVTAKDRFHDETANGELGDASTTPKARVSYVASYYDAANRLTATVDVGTNGGSAYTRPSSVPSASDTVLVVSTGYNAAGWAETVTDARGIVGKTYYDNLGRTVKAIDAYTDGTPTNNTNKTTEYTYDGSNHVLTLQADLPGGGYQRTQYVYGVTTSGGSDVNSNDGLASVQYPDPSSGSPSNTLTESYTANALGQNKTSTDRNGTVHTYSYDVLGRLTADAVTTLASGVDGAVRRLTVAYDTGGRAYLLTSWDAASGGSVVNQVQRAFNGLAQLTTEYQATSGAVNTSTTPKVQYAYSEMAGGAIHSRLVSMTYPNGRALNYNYASGLDDNISRLSSLSDSSATLEAYSYLGLSTVLKRAHPQSGVDLTYIKQTGESNGDAGDQYTGLDRFGRVVNQRWLVSSSGTATDWFAYGYDRDGNPLYRDNFVNSAFAELYHASGSSNGYDQLNQLTDFARGTLNGSKDSISGTASRTQSWSLDALGNWSTLTSDGSSQTSSFNKQNEITAISGLTTSAYDSNANMTTDQTGKTLVYDAWNRLVQVKSGTMVLVSYSFDALSRRVTENPDTLSSLYYSAQWQVLEDQVGGTTQAQYVWSPVYVDALVERDRGSERLYVQQDANWNVTALVDASANVAERYVYDPYGKTSILAPNWSGRSSSSYAWVYLHQGTRLDSNSGLYHVREREYSPSLGRWMQPDPIGFLGSGPNLYEYNANDPVGLNDPSGLTPSGPQPPSKYGPFKWNGCKWVDQHGWTWHWDDTAHGGLPPHWDVQNPQVKGCPKYKVSEKGKILHKPTKPGWPQHPGLTGTGQGPAKPPKGGNGSGNGGGKGGGKGGNGGGLPPTGGCFIPPQEFVDLICGLLGVPEGNRPQMPAMPDPIGVLIEVIIDVIESFRPGPGEGQAGGMIYPECGCDPNPCPSPGQKPKPQAPPGLNTIPPQGTGNGLGGTAGGPGGFGWPGGGSLGGGGFGGGFGGLGGTAGGRGF